MSIRCHTAGKPYGLKVRFYVVLDDLVGLSEGGFHTPNWKLTNSSSRSCMIFRTLNYIHSCNCFHLFNSRFKALTCGFWQMDYKVLLRVMLLVWKMIEMFSIMRKGFPRGLNGLLWMSIIIVLGDHLCM